MVLILFVNQMRQKHIPITKLEGAIVYYWYIDGTLVQSGQFLTMPNLNFSGVSPGMHTICVDAANLPCMRSRFSSPIM